MYLIDPFIDDSWINSLALQIRARIHIKEGFVIYFVELIQDYYISKFLVWNCTTGPSKRISRSKTAI